MKIQEILTNSYDYIIVPKAVLDVPIELSKLAKYDEDETLIGHYSVNELSNELGNLFTPIDMIDERFVGFRWSFDRNREDILTITYLKGMGLINIREQDGDLDKRVEEIDFSALNGNEFGIFSILEVKRVPYTAPIPLDENGNPIVYEEGV